MLGYLPNFITTLTKKRNNVLFLYFCVLSIAFALYHRNLLAQDAGTQNIGKLINIIGKVEIIRNKQTINAETNSPLQEGDEIISYEKSAFKAQFNDGSSLMGFQDSRVKVPKYTITKNEKKGEDVKSLLDVVKGKLRFYVKPQDENSGHTNVDYKTSNSVMGIRGTSGFIDASSEGSSQILVTSGNVQVSSLNDPSKSIVVPANTFTDVVGDKMPTVPKIIPSNILTKLTYEAKIVDPEFGKNEINKPAKQENKNEQKNEKNDGMNKQTEKKKVIYNTSGQSTVVSTESSLNNLIKNQTDTKNIFQQDLGYEALKVTLDKVDTTINYINQNITNIIQTKTQTDKNKTITIKVNSP